MLAKQAGGVGDERWNLSALNENARPVSEKLTTYWRVRSAANPSAPPE
jgi:hypothetical protein